jgi:hypothetical protein
MVEVPVSTDIIVLQSPVQRLILFIKLAAEKILIQGILGTFWYYPSIETKLIVLWKSVRNMNLEYQPDTSIHTIHGIVDVCFEVEGPYWSWILNYMLLVTNGNKSSLQILVAHIQH